VIEDCAFEPPSNALGPLWVWRAFAETPGMPALIGGASAARWCCWAS
jgi:hypothetical protein